MDVGWLLFLLFFSTPDLLSPSSYWLFFLLSLVDKVDETLAFGDRSRISVVKSDGNGDGDGQCEYLDFLVMTARSMYTNCVFGRFSAPTV